VRVAAQVSVEIDRIADAIGARVLYVYLPPPCVQQPEHFAELAVGPDALEVTARIADAWLAFLHARAAEVLVPVVEGLLESR
jgi:hypothetical protein